MTKKLFLVGIMVFIPSLFFFVFILPPKTKPEISSKKTSPHHLIKMPKRSYAVRNAEFEFMQLREPISNSMPSNIKSKELNFVSKLPVKKSHKGQTWDVRGPANISGRMLCMAFDVDDENIINAGSASGGMWKSTNQGQDWKKTTPPYVDQSATCIVQDTRPGKHHIWYYGTGELFSTTDRKVSTNVRTVGIGNGILKSADSGETWQVLQSTAIILPDELHEVFQGVWKIVTDPVTMNKDIVYAACYGAIMRSEDGGTTWALTLGDIENKSFATDMVITSDGVVYAVLSSHSWSMLRPAKAGVWRSVDGINWENITPANFPVDTRVMKLALAESNENIVYLLTESQSDIFEPFGGYANSNITFWKYTWDDNNNNGLWENRTQNIPGGGDGNITSFPNSFVVYGGYAITMNVKSDDEDVVVIGGMNLFRSTNGFADSLQTIQMGGYPYDMDSLHQLHPDMHHIEFLPSDPNVMFITNDGGVYRINDCLMSTPYWYRLNYKLITSQFYTVCIDKATAGDNYILGGLQDNNWYYTVTDNVAEFWFSIDICYDGFAVAIADSLDYCIVAAYSGNIWTTLFEPGFHTKDVYFQLPDTLLAEYDSLMGSNDLFPFYQNFVLDPNNRTFYLPTKTSIWRKDDMKAAAHDSTLRNAGWNHLSNVDVGDAAIISAISISTNPANRIYYGTNLGRVYKLENAHTGNPVPLDITGPSFPYNAFVACIDVDPDDADNIMVAYSNYRVQSLFHSNDGGQTWTAQGGILEEFPDGTGSGPSIRWVEKLNYQNDYVYFVGTSVGLYSTTHLNGDSTIWEKEADNLIGSVIVSMIQVRQSDGFVAIATHGNGIYSTYYNPSIGIDEINRADNNIHLNTYPNPCSGQINIDCDIEKTSVININIYNSSGQLVRNLIKNKAYRTGFTQSFDIGDLPEGLYYVVLNSRDKILTHKILLIR